MPPKPKRGARGGGRGGSRQGGGKRICVPCDMTFPSIDLHTRHTRDSRNITHRSCYACQVTFKFADSYILHCNVQHGRPLPAKFDSNDVIVPKHGSQRPTTRDMRTIPLHQGYPLAQSSTQNALADLPIEIRDEKRVCYPCGLDFPDESRCQQHKFFEHVAPGTNLRCEECSETFGEAGAFEGHLKLHPHTGVKKDLGTKEDKSEATQEKKDEDPSVQKEGEPVGASDKAGEGEKEGEHEDKEVSELAALLEGTGLQGR